MIFRDTGRAPNGNNAAVACFQRTIHPAPSMGGTAYALLYPPSLACCELERLLDFFIGMPTSGHFSSASLNNETEHVIA